MLAHRFCFSIGGGSWHQHIKDPNGINPPDWKAVLWQCNDRRKQHIRHIGTFLPTSESGLVPGNRSPTNTRKLTAICTQAGAMPNCITPTLGCIENSRKVLPPLPPCVTFRGVVVSLRGPGQSPVLPFACYVGSLLSVGRCGRCSHWCRFRVRGAQRLVCRGCAGCGMVCRLRVSGAQ